MDFRTFAQLVMVEQTLFALPFALIGVLFAGGGTWSDWWWVIVALTAARTAGMSFNRVIDAKIDARNPRTQDRPVPRGAVSAGSVWSLAVVSSLVLIGAAFMLNRLCFQLSFLAVFLLFSYSFFKRFSASSHFYLGLVEAAAPIGGYLAVTGAFALVPLVLGFVIMSWIAGLDIVYALQDRVFDRATGLHSIPARLGRARALTLSAACYGAYLAAMIYAGLLTQRQWAYWVAILAIGFIFVAQQRLARSDDLSRGIKLFFKYNLYISPLLFAGTLLDVILRTQP